jgi:hypothetical protein
MFWRRIGPGFGSVYVPIGKRLGLVGRGRRQPIMPVRISSWLLAQRVGSSVGDTIGISTYPQRTEGTYDGSANSVTHLVRGAGGS